MLAWERDAAMGVLLARATTEGEIRRLITIRVDAHGRGLRVDELVAIVEMCNELLAHIDPHVETGWHD